VDLSSSSPNERVTDDFAAVLRTVVRESVPQLSAKERVEAVAAVRERMDSGGAADRVEERGQRGILGVRGHPLRLGAPSLRGVAYGTAVTFLLGIGLYVQTAMKGNARSGLHSSREFVTARAQRLSVTLGDGRTAVLAPETRLRYTIDAAGVHRVDLVGEAFFTIVRRPMQIFVVRTGNVTTRILGTSFDVRRYPADTATQVAVVSGRVAVGAHVLPIVLVAGTVGVITDSTATINNDADAGRVAAWTQGHLVFHNARVATVLAALGRWYGYEFHLADTALAAEYISVGLSTERSAEALNMVKAVLGVTMTFNGNVITLHTDHADGDVPHRPRSSESLTNSKLEVGR